MYVGIQKEIVERKLKCLLLGEVDNFDEIKRSVLGIISGQYSDVTRDGHATNWTHPFGTVRQYNLFSNEGYDNTISNVGRTRDKVLQEFIEPFQALNFRINILGDSSGLNQHIETIEIPQGIKVRFHVPIQTNPGATVFLDGDNYHLEEGKLYYFNNGCCHSAKNTGNTRIHLVWDCIVDKSVNNYVFSLFNSAQNVKSLYQSPIDAHAPRDTD